MRPAPSSCGFRPDCAPRRHRMAAGSRSAMTRAWSRSGIAAASSLRELGRLGAATMAIHWTADGARLAAIDDIGTTIVWDRDGKQLRTLGGASNGMDLTFSPDG